MGGTSSKSSKKKDTVGLTGPKRTYADWLRFGLVLLASFVHSGAGPGAGVLFSGFTFAGPVSLFWFRCDGDNVIGAIGQRIEDDPRTNETKMEYEIFFYNMAKSFPQMMQLFGINAPLTCDSQFTAMTGTLIVGTTLSTMMLFPALVLVDRYGPRFIAAIGAVMNVVGQCLIPVAFYFSYTKVTNLLWLVMYMSFFLSETGARLVGAGLHGFVWHLDGRRKTAFIMIAILFCLQPFTGYFSMLALVSTITSVTSPKGIDLSIAEGYYSTLIIGAFIILMCTPSRKEYKEKAAEVLGMPVLDWDFKTSKLQHVRDSYRYAKDVLKMSYIRNITFGFTVVCMTAWVTLYKCMSAVYGSDMFGGNVADDVGIAIGAATNFTGVGDASLFPTGKGFDNIKNDYMIGNTFASMVIRYTSVTSAIAMVGGMRLMEKSGMAIFMLCLCGAQFFASSLIYRPVWGLQIVVSICAGISLGGSYVVISKHMVDYAPPKAVASATTLFYFCVAVGSLILMLVAIEVIHLLSLATALYVVTDLSFFMTFIYTLTCFYQGEPSTSALGPGEELQACRLYACKSVNEVLYVTGFDNLEVAKQAPVAKTGAKTLVKDTEAVAKAGGSKKNVSVADDKEAKKKGRKNREVVKTPWEVMQNMLASSEPAVQTAIVRSIRPERMEEKLTKLANSEILHMIQEGLVWESGAKRTFLGPTGGFAITPQLWAQFWRQEQDVSMLTPPQEPGDEDEVPSSTTVATQAANGNGDGKYVPKVINPNEVKWKKDMLRSLGARQHTKELAKILRQGDKQALTEWLLNTPVEQIVAAVWDMTQWDKAVENAASVKEEDDYQMYLTDMFNAMFPLDALSNLMLQRPSLKPVLVECMKRDLIKAQLNLEKAASGRTDSATRARGSVTVIDATATGVTASAAGGGGPSSAA